MHSTQVLRGNPKRGKTTGIEVHYIKEYTEKDKIDYNTLIHSAPTIQGS